MSSKTTTKNESKQNQQQQSTTTPLVDPRVDPFYMNIAGQTNHAVNSVDRSPLVGPALAGVNQFDTRSMMDANSMISALQGQRTPGEFTSIVHDAASGRLMDPATNPALRGMIDASIRPVTEQLNRVVLPGLDTASMMDNAFGGDRAQLMRGQAYGDWAQSAGDITSKLNYDNYTRERQNQLNAPAMYQDAVNAEMALPQMLSQLGDQQRRLDQIPIDNQIMSRALNEQFAFAGLPQAAQIMSSLPYVGSSSQGTSSGTSSDVSTTQTKQNPLTSVVQAGLGIGSMMSGLGWTPFAQQTPGSTGTGTAGALSGIAGVGTGGLGRLQLATTPRNLQARM